jgi:hypothetical protein
MRCIIIELLALFIFIPDMAFCGAKPRPPAYLDWTKLGATILDVKKIFLECGWPSSDPGNEEIEQAGMTINDQALAELCMMRNGFVCRDKTWCYYNPSLPACQPGAVIPTPSVERRLKSWWCSHDYTFYGCVQHDERFQERCIKYDWRKRSKIPQECLP